MTAPPRPTSPARAQDADTAAVRLFVPDDLQAGTTVALSAPQSHHLLTVLRKLPGSTARLFNGSQGEFLGRLRETRRDACLMEVGEPLRPQAPDADLWLVFALLKRTPTDMVVQKATELGVSAILPVFTTRTNADRTNLARLRAIATEAAEQSERLTLPLIHEPRALGAVLTQWPQERRLVACLERQEAPGITQVAGPDAVLIGPEGGFTASELDVLRSCPFVEPATLGRRVLRAETAAIVGLGRMLTD